METASGLVLTEMNDLHLINWLNKQHGWFIAGSQAIHPASDRDMDIVVLVSDYEESKSLTWVHGFVESDNSNYCALQPNKFYERGDVDLIVTDKYETYILWHKATEVCKALDLTSREDRVKVHHILLEREDSYKRAPVTAELLLL